jgi:hypothetical protein
MADFPNGSPMPPPLPPRPDPTPTRRSNSIWGIVVGIASVILFFPFGPILGPIAISLGLRARRGVRRGDFGWGAAVAAIVLGSVGAAAGVFVWVVASVCDCM